PSALITRLARDDAWELRAQAAWLIGLRGRDEIKLLLTLLEDADPFVRRRAAEALTRLAAPEAIPKLIEHLGDPARLVRHVCLAALAHYSTTEWLDTALANRNPKVQIHALAAAFRRGEVPKEVPRVVRSLLDEGRLVAPEDRLDFLRILSLSQETIEG